MCIQTLRRTAVRILAFCLVVYGSSGVIFGDGPVWSRVFSSLVASLLTALWTFVWFLIGETLVGQKK